ncbi:Subtilase family protein [Caloramator fervidus]|uniref:Subtilase family protein n=1 Tax=Caloramator fervidus TaxID=29344 RepID=A0A1H5WNX6_9CLOT|nr:S8 family serine peptidase [Caloramator fervidus]SEG01172.1 Subtilase family protein [Caloramator fervidus]
MFFSNKKIDPYIKNFLSINLKNKIPILISFKDDSKKIKGKITSLGGKIKWEYENIKAVSCELSPLSIDYISEYPEVSFICFDYKGNLCLKEAEKIMGINYPRLFKLTGKNIGIGIVDTGVYPHPDLTIKRNAITYFKDLINGIEKPYDDNGHGTFLSGCIAASKYSSNLEGIAPDSNIIMIKAFDSCGKGFLSDVVKAIDILINIASSYNIRIINLPFEFNINIKNPLEDIIKVAISKNICIVAPSGNSGPYNFSINCPGNIEEVITVGGAEGQERKNCKICSFSGKGPLLNKTQKPDVVAPASNVVSLATDPLYTPGKPSKMSNLYTIKSGTSIASALISGALAIILEKNPDLTPKDLKSIICLSTISLGENKFSQGKGLFIFDKILK